VACNAFFGKNNLRKDEIVYWKQWEGPPRLGKGITNCFITANFSVVLFLLIFSLGAIGFTTNIANDYI